MSWLVYIPTCRLPSLPAVASLSHGPSNCPASSLHLANDFQCIINVSLFGLGANLWAKDHQKGKWPASHLGQLSYQISSPCVNPCWRYLLQKILRTHRQTANDISPACLSACGAACGDNKYIIVCPKAKICYTHQHYHRQWLPNYHAKEILQRKPSSHVFVSLAWYLHPMPNQQHQRTKGDILNIPLTKIDGRWMIENKVDRAWEIDQIWIFIKSADGISHGRQVNQCWQTPAQTNREECVPQ